MVYVEGKDLFKVVLTDNGTKVEDVYFDNLVSVIDNLVEKTSNYKQSVEEEYGVKWKNKNELIFIDFYMLYWSDFEWFNWFLMLLFAY